MGEIDFIKNVIVVDEDIDPFNEQEVMWSVATHSFIMNSKQVAKTVLEIIQKTNP